jgi:hypothetical protein
MIVTAPIQPAGFNIIDLSDVCTAPANLTLREITKLEELALLLAPEHPPVREDFVDYFRTGRMSDVLADHCRQHPQAAYVTLIFSQATRVLQGQSS